MTKTYVTILGVVFVLIGILGFIDPLTPDGNLLGIFAVNTEHNLVHLLSGLVALAAVAGGAAYATLYAKVFGLVYALVTILGFMVGDGEVLHVLIAASALYFGFVVGEGDGRRATA